MAQDLTFISDSKTTGETVFPVTQEGAELIPSERTSNTPTHLKIHVMGNRATVLLMLKTKCSLSRNKLV